MRCSLVIGLLLCSCLAAGAAGGFARRVGTQLLDGDRPVRLVSVNKYNLFWCFIRGGEHERQARAALASARDCGFTVIRTSAAPYWPLDAREWAKGDSYWRRADACLAAARESGLRLILTVNWNWQMFADLAGESMQDLLTNRQSRSWQYLALYTSQLVGRYRDDPTVFMWELSNELNLGADLEFMHPYGYLRQDGQPLDLGVPVAYVARDNYRTAHMNQAARDLARLIRQLDPNHLIGSGYSVPRPAAAHLRARPAHGDWTLDTQQETLRMLQDTHPDPIDCISIHIYADDMQHWGLKGDAPRIVRTFKQLADRLGKPLYIGETGASPPRLPFLSGVLQAAVDCGVPLTLIWQWDTPDDASNNYTPDTEPAVVKLMQDLNRPR